jgi:Flp pilus assembly protein TadG
MSRSKRSRGYALVWLAVAMTAMMGLVSFGVDMGRVEMAKTQLRRAADAAARYAAPGVSDGTATSRAIAAAADNLVDGTPLVLLNSDVTTGRWNNGNLVGGTADSVRITAVRTAARGTGIPLLFAQIIGQSKCDLHVTVTAKFTAPQRFGIVGLASVSMNGNSADTYYSAAGATTWQSAATNLVDVMSNGNISLSGGATIHGNANPGIGKTVSTSGGSTVTGSTANLTTTLSYPNATAGSASTTNNNASLSATYFNSGNRNFNVAGGASVTLPGGTYYMNDLTLSGGSSLSFSGPVVLYLTGKLDFSGGSVSTSGSLPTNMQINMCSTNTVNLSGSSTIYATVYSPSSDLTLSGTTSFCGSVIAGTITMSGSATIHYDKSLGGTGSGVTLVQ